MKSSSSRRHHPVPVKVLTFDLDDTIWKTSRVITEANAALQKHLNSEFGQEELPQVFKVMRMLFESNPGNYYKALPEVEEAQAHQVGDGLEGAVPPADGEVARGQSKEKKREPVYLTKLRTDALACVYAHVKVGGGGNDASLVSLDVPTDPGTLSFAKSSFQVWHAARHTSVSSNLAAGVEETFQYLRSKFGEDMLIGAITNGNGDPKYVPELEPYFDFCVNSEQVGLSKPRGEIYEAAISVAREIRPNLPENVGSWWVHMGDDMIKDIVASKGFGMRTIYTTEFKNTEGSGKDESVGVHISPSAANANSKMDSSSPDGLDYLEAKFKEDFCDSVVEQFCDIKAVIEEFSGGCSTTDDTIMDAEAIPAMTMAQQLKNIEVEEEDSMEKFCTNCGERRGAGAKFCGACGRKFLGQ